jgi:hypothetical protein
MRQAGPINSGLAAGGNGVAAGNASGPNRISGRIYAIYVKYNATCPATTVVTIATAGNGAPAQTLLTTPAGNTSQWFYPRVQVQTTAGAAIAATYDRLAVDDNINVAISLANALCNADVFILMDD